TPDCISDFISECLHVSDCVARSNSISTILVRRASLGLCRTFWDGSVAVRRLRARPRLRQCSCRKPLPCITVLLQFGSPPASPPLLPAPLARLWARRNSHYFTLRFRRALVALCRFGPRPR